MDGVRLKQLRLEKGLTQKALGEKVGVAGSTIRMMELDNRGGSINVLSALADFFGVSMDFLEGKTEYKNANDVVSDMVNKLIEHNIAINDDVIALIHESLNKK